MPSFSPSPDRRPADAACSMAPEYSRPDVDPPRAVVSSGETGSLADLPWWDVFRDPVQELIRTGLSESKDVRIALRVAQARAWWTVTRSRLLPQIGTGASVFPNGSRRWDSPSASKTSERLDDPNITLSEVGLGISFDLDLSGELRGASEPPARTAGERGSATGPGRHAVATWPRRTSTCASWTSSRGHAGHGVTRMETLQIVRLRHERAGIRSRRAASQDQVDTTDASSPILSGARRDQKWLSVPCFASIQGPSRAAAA